MTSSRAASQTSLSSAQRPSGMTGREQGDTILEQRAMKSTCASGFNHARVRWGLSGCLSIPLPLHLWYLQYGKVFPNVVTCVHQTPEEHSTHSWTPREKFLHRPKAGAEPLLPRLAHVASPQPVTVAQKMLCSDWPGLGHMPPMEGWTSPTLTLWTESGEGVAVSKGNVGCCYQKGEWWSAGKNNRCPLHTPPQTGLNAQFHVHNQVSYGDFCCMWFSPLLYYINSRAEAMLRILFLVTPAPSLVSDTLEVFTSYFLKEWSSVLVSLWRAGDAVSSSTGSIVVRQKEHRR